MPSPPPIVETTPRSTVSAGSLASSGLSKSTWKRAQSLVSVPSTRVLTTRPAAIGEVRASSPVPQNIEYA